VQGKLLSDQATACVREGRTTQAVALLSEVIRRTPTDAGAYLNHGSAQASAGEVGLALSDYTTALHLQPDLVEAWYDRGTIFTHIRRYERAISDFTEAIRLKPDFALAYCNRGLANLQLGRYDDALAEAGFEQVGNEPLPDVAGEASQSVYFTPDGEVLVIVALDPTAIDDLFGDQSALLAELGAGHVLVALAVTTIILGSLAALAQDNLKRLLAFSTVSQLSYVVLGATLGNPTALTGGVVHIASHALLKITLFFCAGALYVTAHLERVSQLGGIGWRMPWTDIWADTATSVA